MKTNLAIRHSWRATLLVKEIRQSAGIIVVMWAPLLLFLFVRWLINVLLGGLERLSFAGLFYLATVIVAGALGSSFLAGENRTGSVNFLLRLPVSRRKVYCTKTLCRLTGVIIYCAISFAVVNFLSTHAAISWGRWTPGDVLDAGFLVLLMYFLAVCCSILLDREIAAFLAAAVGVVVGGAMLQFGVHLAVGGAMLQFGGHLIAKVITLGGYPDMDLIAIVGLCLEVCLVGAAAGLSWWLFSRKEGR